MKPKNLSVFLTIVLAAATLASANPGYFDGCGVLVQGIECVLFKADTGRLYVLDNLEHFQVGNHVQVRGVLNPDCATICMQGDGCIEQNTISACPPDYFDDCGVLVLGVECVLFQADTGELYVLDNFGNFQVGNPSNPGQVQQPLSYLRR